MRQLIIVGVETGLIIGFAIVAKWIVHINLHFAIFASVRPLPFIIAIAVARGARYFVLTRYAALTA